MKKAKFVLCAVCSVALITVLQHLQLTLLRSTALSNYSSSIRERQDSEHEMITELRQVCQGYSTRRPLRAPWHLAHDPIHSRYEVDSEWTFLNGTTKVFDLFAQRAEFLTETSVSTLVHQIQKGDVEVTPSIASPSLYLSSSALQQQAFRCPDISVCAMVTQRSLKLFAEWFHRAKLGWRNGFGARGQGYSVRPVVPLCFKVMAAHRQSELRLLQHLYQHKLINSEGVRVESQKFPTFGLSSPFIRFESELKKN